MPESPKHPIIILAGINYRASGAPEWGEDCCFAWSNTGTNALGMREVK